MATRANKKRQARRQWLQAGRHCFARDGYEGAALEHIAAEAGLSRPGFFLYFASKAALRTAIRLELLHGLAMLAGQEAEREGSAGERLQRALSRMQASLQAEAALVQGTGLLGCGLEAAEVAECQAWQRLAQGLARLAGQPAAGEAQQLMAAAVLRGGWQALPVAGDRAALALTARMLLAVFRPEP